MKTIAMLPSAQCRNCWLHHCPAAGGAARQGSGSSGSMALCVCAPEISDSDPYCLDRPLLLSLADHHSLRGAFGPLAAEFERELAVVESAKLLTTYTTICCIYFSLVSSVVFPRKFCQQSAGSAPGQAACCAGAVVVGRIKTRLCRALSVSASRC